MRRNLLALASLVLLAGSACAKKPAPGFFVPPTVQVIPQRVLQADTIVVGKVTSVQDKIVKVARFKGDVQLAEYRLFTVKIDSALKGAGGLTHIKVGCLVPAPVVPARIEGISPQGGPPGRFRQPILPPPMLEKGQEVLLFLRPHVSEPFYTASAQGDVTDSKAGNFKADVEETKKVVKVLAEPIASLKAKESSDRYFAAALLVVNYRSSPGAATEEAISAEESKLILQGLAGGNFNAPQLSRGYDPFAPMQMFYLLQPQTAGWVQPRNFQEVPASMKKWLEDNAGKFRVKRFVAVKSE